MISLVKGTEIKLDSHYIAVGNILPVDKDKLQKISGHKFYILIIDREGLFPKKYFWVTVEVIEKIGGFIEVADANNEIITKIFGSDNNQNKKISSVVIITNREGKIVGAYNNKKLSDLIDILQLHPDLIDLDLAGTAL